MKGQCLVLVLLFTAEAQAENYMIYFWDYNSIESEKGQEVVALKKDCSWCDIRACNVSDYPSVARYFKVTSIPQLVLVRSIKDYDDSKISPGEGDYDTGFRLRYPFDIEQLNALSGLPYTYQWQVIEKTWLKLTHYLPFGLPARKHRKDIPPPH
jgi:hypothetical protein